MKNIFSVAKILMTLFILWIIFSIGYIVYDQSGKFKNQDLATAYRQGEIDTVNSLMTQAYTCKPMPITVGDKTVQFIATECLEKQDATTPVVEADNSESEE